MSNAIVYNGEKIELSNCLKKDPRSYYNGWIFLKSDEYEYAEFTYKKNILCNFSTKV